MSFSSSDTGTFGSGGTCTLSPAGATSESCSVTYTPGDQGTPTITGSYGGSTIDTARPSGSTSLAVGTRLTSTAVSCSPTTVPLSETTTCLVTVTDTDAGTATAPAGTVTLALTGSGSFTPTSGTCTLSPGTTSSTCSVSYIPSATGTPSISASYPGDVTHSGSNGSEVLTVVLHSTTTAVACSPSSFATPGSPSTCTVTVTDTTASPSPPTGATVSFTNDGQGSFGATSCVLANPTTASASCSVAYTPSASGAQHVTGSFPANALDGASSGHATIVIGQSVPDTTTTTVSCTPTSGQVAVQTSCTATVTDTTSNVTPPTGTVSFSSVGSGVFGSGQQCTLSPAGYNVHTATCSLAYTPKAAGSQTINASYGTVSGTPGFASSSGATSITVTARATQTTVACSPPSLPVSGTTTCTGTVLDTTGGAVPAGALAFTSTGSGKFSASGSCSLVQASSDSASCSTIYTPSATGSPSIAGSYRGSATEATSNGATSITAVR